ncbi:MAG: hypothetical protein ACON42_06025 [Flavobacteriaceae bacterium]
MHLKTKALLGNLTSFGILFFGFRYGIAYLIPLPYVPLAVGSAVAASFLSPKFLIKEDQLYLKLFWKKQPSPLK